MLYEAIDDPGSVTPADLRERYYGELAGAVESVGIDAVVAATDLDREAVAALAEGGTPTLDLADAATIAALQPDAPDSETILLEIRDHLLLGMSVAVMDVEALAAALDDELSPKQLQGMIEGRTSMTLEEYASIQHAIARGRS